MPKPRPLTPTLAGLLAAFALIGPARGDDPAAVEFFEKQVRPILTGRCQGCHGPDKQKGGLRLDSRASALAGGETGPAVVPGGPGESLLVEAINYGDLYRMPPKSKLPEAEIAALTKWVASGAHWPDAGKPTVTIKPFDLKARLAHWSFQPVRDVAPPAVRDADWPRTPIDRFLLAELERRGLGPADDADRRTFIRRLAFDLTGLPPTPEEVETFVDDREPMADGRLVDRLLASPHHGERWARHWLDLVRFAETAGHEFDYDTLGAWRYRDYVIRAFNDDLPYDQLVVEHLAGDLLDRPRRNPSDGTNESILATGFFFLGEGVHSPVDVREDGMRRVENQIDVASKAFLGLTVACARCHDHKFDAISQRDYYALAGYLRSSRHQQAFIDPPERFGPKLEELARLKAELVEAKSVPDPDSTRSADPPRSVLFADFDGPTFGDWSATGHAFGAGPSRSGDLRIGPDDAMHVAGGIAHSGLISDRLQGVLRSKTFTIEHKFIHHLAAGRHGRINVVVDGFEKIRAPIYGGLTAAIESPTPRWFAQDVSMWVGHDAYIELADGATVNYTGGRSELFAGDGWLAVDEVRFSDEPSLPPSKGPIEVLARGLPADVLTRYREVESTLPAPTLATAILDGTGRDEPLHLRGNHKTLGPAVPRRFLEAIGGDEQPTANESSGRLELARRMVDPKGPLIARVLVNRLWKHHFGEGLVRSPDDFGAMGQAPSHPELLDWLASEFIRNGWSIKHMQRLMVISRAYRMSSHDQTSEDPDNRLLHRMNVRRLEAEAIRDAMLACSGRLDRTLFGPSVPPHLTPFMDGRGKPAASGPLDGDGRRGVYLNVRRNFLDPMLLAFDFPSPTTTIGRRNVSNVPAQALTLLNDPFVVEQAGRWADRLLIDPSRGDEVRLRDAYMTAFGRPPTEAEVVEARAFLDGRERRQAWIELCHVLFNTKEFIFIP